MTNKSIKRFILILTFWYSHIFSKPSRFCRSI